MSPNPPVALSRKRPRRGATAIETAIVLSMISLFVFGIIEFSRALMVHQVMVTATREAGRRAVIPRETQSDVQSVVATYMSHAGVTGFTQELHVNGSAANLSTASSGDTLTVRLVVPYGQVSWGVLGLINPSRQFITEVEMRKE